METAEQKKAVPKDDCWASPERSLNAASSVIASGISAAASIWAALLWIKSTDVSIPDPGQFPITVTQPDAAMGPVGGTIGGQYVGSGSSPAVQFWASIVSAAFAKQSELSADAAKMAALAGAAAGAAFLLQMALWFLHH